MRGRTSRNKGFTLLEVVIALAVFAFLIGGLLGFLPWSLEGVSKVREQDTAYGLVDGVQIELERMGFTLVEAGTNRLTGFYSPFDEPREAPVELELLLVARREGGLVSFEQVVEKAELAFLNGTQLEEGVNQDIYSKTMGGLVYFNLKMMRNQFHFSDSMTLMPKLTLFQQGGFHKKRDIFSLNVLSFHLGTDMSITQAMVF